MSAWHSGCYDTRYIGRCFHQKHPRSPVVLLWGFPSANCEMGKQDTWGWVTDICISKLTIFASDNGLLPGQRQAIIWTNAGISLIRTLGTQFSEILIKIHTFSSGKMHLKMSSGKCRPFCLGLNVLTIQKSCCRQVTWSPNSSCPAPNVSCPTYIPSWKESEYM